MYEIIKNVINSKDYELREMLYKINKMYIESAITEAEKTELDNLARENAKPENSYAPLQEQIDDIYKKLELIKQEIQELKETENTEEPEEPVEEYPEYKAPSGAHDAYNTGDKIAFKGKKYVCTMDNCVWSPEVYPQGWEEVIEATEITEPSTEENVESEG